MSTVALARCLSASALSHLHTGNGKRSWDWLRQSTCPVGAAGVTLALVPLPSPSPPSTLLLGALPSCNYLHSNGNTCFWRTCPKTVKGILHLEYGFWSPLQPLTPDMSKIEFSSQLPSPMVQVCHPSPKPANHTGSLPTHHPPQRTGHGILLPWAPI